VVPGRCEVIDEDQEFGVIIDSANTPRALSRLLDSVRDMGPRRIILVVGCEGEQDRDARPFVGEIAHYKATPTSTQPSGLPAGADVSAVAVCGQSFLFRFLTSSARHPCNLSSS